MHGTQAGLEVDKKFLDTARQLHTSNAHFRPVPNAFVVKHYAGEVTVSGTIMIIFFHLSPLRFASY
jgi:myosin heavy subunit